VVRIAAGRPSVARDGRGWRGPWKCARFSERGRPAGEKRATTKHTGNRNDGAGAAVYCRRFVFDAPDGTERRINGA